MGNFGCLVLGGFCCNSSVGCDAKLVHSPSAAVFNKVHIAFLGRPQGRLAQLHGPLGAAGLGTEGLMVPLIDIISANLRVPEIIFCPESMILCGLQNKNFEHLFDVDPLPDS